ncbi:MAG: hypothetical protein UT63_C0007G0011 [Candidatus Gottesmanbacteria bacterium GW2011_GWC2_39_8]|uniref:Orotate phosphoribosyltransferase n=1 Tax=Candidatus Gottesmanbacteria bacterium GW2011_GWC2_39_8 TaxID=1618450 RepID=A0A0G0Q9P1_9BACT|nr:MAG: hypothetical protein UT63_C0007G0011 [Candidatus Gottesmanbacteria bacterium GW2011_GWC2_39_8]
MDITLKERLILDLFTINAIKFGDFKLKSGTMSPFYLDLRVLVSYPYLLELTANVFWGEMRVFYFDVIVGVPYTAIPIATTIALKQNQHMIFVRKERKDHGTGRLIEGDFHTGQKAILLDDVITNGESKFETIKPLEDAGLKVEDVIILLDRGQGGVELLNKRGYRCHAIFRIEEVFQILLKYKRVDKALIEKCIKYIKET